MDNPGRPPGRDLPLPGSEAALAVKDGVRQVRFKLRRGARRLVDGAQAVAQVDDLPAVPGPLALLGEPLEHAVRTTARVLRKVDHAAVDLLFGDGPFRALEVPLRSSASYFEAPVEPGAVRHFTQDHYWRYRHLLAMGGRTDVFVREQNIERAGQQLAAGWTLAGGGAPEGDRFRRLAQIVVTLAASDILAPVASPEHESHRATVELAWRAAACSVLVGEIAIVLPDQAPKDKTTSALRLAAEIMDATQPAWTQDSVAGAPVAGLALWLNFALRHV